MRSDQILARTMKYGDELTLLELGDKVERAQGIESTYKFDTLGQLLFHRVFSKTEDVRRWERRRRVRGSGSAGSYPDGDVQTPPTPVAHGIECPCDACHAAVKRLLVACGVLPRGKRLMGRGKP